VTGTSIDLDDLAAAGWPAGEVWLLDDPRHPASVQALGIAERLGVPFRRIPLRWNPFAYVSALAPRGSLFGATAAGPWLPQAERLRPAPPARRPLALAGVGTPALVLSAGQRAAAVALWLKARFGAHIVHCTRPALYGKRFDLLVLGEHERPPPWGNVLPILGMAHRLSPLALCQAEASWRERLAHLPRPRVALLAGGPVGGTDMVPALAHTLGLRVAALARRHGGSVLAATRRRTGREASDALAAGLATAMHVVHRESEPDASPNAGFLALADAVVVTGDAVMALAEACATAAPVFVAHPELGRARQRRLHASLFAAGQARPFADDIAPWPRRPLDEAGRAAAEIAQRFLLDPTTID
jgi:uncharacterized protein